MTRAAVVILLVAAAAGAAWGAARFPPPEFDTAYRMPEPTTPGRPVAWWDRAPEYVDVLVLAGVLALAAVLALRVRSRTAILLLMLGALLYFGFYRKGCVCPIGAVQNVAEALGAGGAALPLTVVLFFALPLAAALLFGRTFCAAACPLGAVQDAVLVRPLRVPAALEHALGLLPYVYLGAAALFAATGAAYVICEYDPFVALFRLVDLPMLQTSGGVSLLVLAGIFLAISLLVGRPYCRYACPYGAILRVLSRVSWRHVTIAPEECVACSLCEDACPFGAIRKPTAPRPGTARTEGRGRLAALLALAPVLVLAGGATGWWLGEPMARMHRRVRLADLVRRAETAGFTPTADEADILEAFASTGEPAEALRADARAVAARFAGAWKHFVVRLWTGRRYKVGVFVPGGAAWFGAFVGLVVGLKLVHLSIRRRRVDYEPDRATCFSCGRCFAYCPIQRDRAKKARRGEAKAACPREGLPVLVGAAGPSKPEGT